LRLARSRFTFELLSTSRIDGVSFSSFESAWRNGLVLCDSSSQTSTIVNFWSASFAESAERSAPMIIFFGSA